MLGKAKDLYKLQKEARKIKKELKKIHVEAEEEGVIVVVNGEQEVIKVEISDEATADKKKLQELLVKCFNKAIKKAQEVAASMMKDFMGDLNLPGM